MPNEIEKIAKELGSRGGKKTASRGSEYMKKIGRSGAQKRWGKKVKSYRDINPEDIAALQERGTFGAYSAGYDRGVRDFAKWYDANYFEYLSATAVIEEYLSDLQKEGN